MELELKKLCSYDRLHQTMFEIENILHKGEAQLALLLKREAALKQSYHRMKQNNTEAGELLKVSLELLRLYVEIHSRKGKIEVLSQNLRESILHQNRLNGEAHLDRR